jgi:hypothetical protein
MKNKYSGKEIILTTKHNKIKAIAPHFSSILQADVTEYNADTDTLGTFSGEVERSGTQKECAIQKCLIGMNAMNKKFAIANEGSFGPHPYIGFISADIETMIFIDRELDFEIFLTEIDTNTNFHARRFDNFSDLDKFMKATLFPSHALIVRPNIWQDKSIIFKGIVNYSKLKEYFEYVKSKSEDSAVWVETDMRANFNPSRMAVIAKLAKKMAERLLSCCPKCNTPGFGVTKTENNLECNYCGMETDLIKYFVHTCVKCDYLQRHKRTDIEYADMSSCKYCNP